MEKSSNEGDFMTIGKEHKNMGEEYQPRDKENENNNNQAKAQDIELIKKTTKDEQTKSYKVGYKKPPAEYQWEKGCKSPNPKGRPKKPTSLIQSVQFAYRHQAKTTDENGKTCKKTYLEILGLKAVQDAIKKDGPTRRLLMSKDYANLSPAEPELEYPENKKEIARIEKEYGEILRKVVEMDPQIREMYIKYFAEVLRDVVNQRVRNGEV